MRAFAVFAQNPEWGEPTEVSEGTPPQKLSKAPHPPV